MLLLVRFDSKKEKKKKAAEMKSIEVFLARRYNRSRVSNLALRIGSRSKGEEETRAREKRTGATDAYK